MSPGLCPGTPQTAPTAVYNETNATARLRVLPRPPHDLEAELAVLAELARPLHVVPSLGEVDGNYFYDRRNATCVAALRARSPLSEDDSAYIAHAVEFAMPVTQTILASFFDCHERRHRLFELERERLELLGVVA